MIDVRAHLARKPLLFDGGMGTYYKAKPGTECEQGNLLDPAGVRKVHREYLAAGAEAIKTNTFGLPRMAAARQPDWQALARKARDFVGVDAEDDTRSIHDWQPTVPVHKAFREPVYPKNPNNHQQEGPSA